MASRGCIVSEAQAGALVTGSAFNIQRTVTLSTDAVTHVVISRTSTG